ncbi:MAG TPA: sterol desaturase family protein [Allosphingosinicella sp.]|jgi:sterol desaturase/sphingolipid hydroxylase (fatty acid hydroxylase superfamily)
MLEAYLFVIVSMLAVPLLLLPVERLAPVERRQPARRLLFNLAYGPCIYAFALLVLVVSAPISLFVAGQSGGGLLPRFGGPAAPVAAQLLFALAFAFAWDFCQYWLHRLEHRRPLLWEIHLFHHQETALNVAAYARGHPLGVVAVVLFNLPLALLFGSQAPHAAAAFVLFPLWGFVTHANLRLGFGPVTPLIASPQWHRIHHSSLPEHRDRNFANLFPIIDIAFGTYHRPGRDEYPPTGAGGEPVGDLRSATVQPFIAWWRMARERPAGPIPPRSPRADPAPRPPARRRSPR